MNGSVIDQLNQSACLRGPRAPPTPPFGRASAACLGRRTAALCRFVLVCHHYRCFLPRRPLPPRAGERGGRALGPCVPRRVDGRARAPRARLMTTFALSSFFFSSAEEHFKGRGEDSPTPRGCQGRESSKNGRSKRPCCRELKKASRDPRQQVRCNCR